MSSRGRRPPTRGELIDRMRPRDPRRSRDPPAPSSSTLTLVMIPSDRCFRYRPGISRAGTTVSVCADSRCGTTCHPRVVSRGSVFTATRVDWQRADIRLDGIHLCSFGRRAFDEVRVSGPSLPSSRSGPAVKGSPTGPSREAAPLTAGERRLRSRSYCHDVMCDLIRRTMGLPVPITPFCGPSSRTTRAWRASRCWRGAGSS